MQVFDRASSRELIRCKSHRRQPPSGFPHPRELSAIQRGGPPLSFFFFFFFCPNVRAITAAFLRYGLDFSILLSTAAFRARPFGFARETQENSGKTGRSTLARCRRGPGHGWILARQGATV